MTTISALPAGHRFANIVRALTIARGDIMMAEAYCQGRGQQQEAFLFKALVAPTSLADLSAAMLPFSLDLAAVLRSLTITGRLQGLRRVPFMVRPLRQNTGVRAGFVGEGRPAPVSAESFEALPQLQPYKVEAIVVLADEVVRLISQASSELISSDAASALQTALDTYMWDPSYSGVAGIVGPSITHDATRLTSSGSTLAAVDADLKAMLNTLTGYGMPLTTASWILHPKTATWLSLLRGSGGAPAFPTITARGGLLAGLPVVTSAACASGGSPGERFMVLAEASEILLADDNETEIAISQQAALQMSDTPATGAQAEVSLWQENLSAMKTSRYVSWASRRTGAVAVLESVAY